MLFKLDQDNHDIDWVPSKTLADIGWLEADLQAMLFANLEKVLQDTDLILLMQSVQGAEEPDLMALDRNGDLYIFELKAWESTSENILQALRYGQIYGQANYERLNSLYLRTNPGSQSLIEALRAKFEVEILEEDINRRQHFVIVTNGLDFRTREAVLYWRSKNLDVRAWLYRVYQLDSEILFEMNVFELQDNPYSDVAEGYYILNTNLANSEDDDHDMVENGKAAAYFDPWKRNIEKIGKGNTVFLYRSGQGIVGYGVADGQLRHREYQGDPELADEEFYMKLTGYRILENPVPASEIKQVTGVNYVFMATMFGIDAESGKRIVNHIKKTRN